MILGLFIFLTSCSGESTNELGSWLGYYGWADSIIEDSMLDPKSDSGRTPLWEEVIISIYEEDGNYYADYVRNGYMMGEIAKAEVHGDSREITLVFIAYAPDSPYQSSLKKGDELFSLTKKENELITTWITDEPNFDEYEGSVEGVYFNQDDVNYYKEMIDLLV
jgi:hypothetical protein